MKKFIKRSAPLVSVLILTYNRTDLLKDCLASVLKSDYPNLEFIVSDNASQDDIAGFVKKNYPWKKIKVYKKRKNGGLTGGFNFGYQYCRGKYVMLLCNDTTITKKSISEMVKMAENDPEIGAIAPKVTQMRNPGYIHSAGSFLTSTGLLYHYGVYQKAGKKYQKSYYIFSTTGAGFLVRSETIKKSGLYSEDFFMAYDESDLCHRVWLSGYSIVYNPKAEVKHMWSATMQVINNPQIWFWNQRNIISSFVYNFQTQYLLPFLISINVAFIFFSVYRLFSRQRVFSATIIQAYLWHIFHIGQTLKRRRAIQKSRKVSDREIFQKVMINPNWGYYLIHFQKKYTDMELPKRALYQSKVA